MLRLNSLKAIYLPQMLKLESSYISRQSNHEIIYSIFVVAKMANMTKNYHSCDIFEQFEIHRLSANRHLSKYFECLDQPQGTDRLAGLNTKVISSRSRFSLY